MTSAVIILDVPLINSPTVSISNLQKNVNTLLSPNVNKTLARKEFLDIMTITIAAITIEIAVDNTIHYIHRYSDEIVKDQDYAATVRRCHNSIGRAMYYTSITVITGFSILVFSRFVPTIYFGVLAGFARFVAIIADLALLPLILMIVRPVLKNMPSIQLKLQYY